MEQQKKDYFNLRFFSVIGFIIGNAYYFGNDPNESLYLFLIYLFCIIWNISYFIIIATIRTLINSISDLLIRDDIEGSSQRKISLDISVSQFLFFSSWWITIIIFLLLHPIAKAHDEGFFFTFLVFLFLIGDFTVRQLSLNWVWRNDSYLWGYSYATQIRFILRYLIVAPSLIIASLYYNINFYEIDYKPSFKVSEFWYFFSFCGFVSIFLWFKKIYESFYKPEIAWRELESITHEELE